MIGDAVEVWVRALCRDYQKPGIYGFAGLARNRKCRAPLHARRLVW
jgi:hypothetical protein